MYSTGKSVVVPSQASGVKIGVSVRMKPRVVEEIAHRIDDFVADAKNRLLPFAADPQMTAVEQVIDAVLFGSDRVIVRFADDLQVVDVDLVAARGALVRARRAGDDDRGFL